MTFFSHNLMRLARKHVSSKLEANRSKKCAYSGQNKFSRCHDDAQYHTACRARTSVPRSSPLWRARSVQCWCVQSEVGRATFVALLASEVRAVPEQAGTHVCSFMIRLGYSARLNQINNQTKISRSTSHNQVSAK